jgi:putative transposase
MSTQDSSFPQRKRLAHGVLGNDWQPTILFDTVCTRNRHSWLANDTMHQVLREVWSESSLWQVGRYILMPDHIHLFVAATSDTINYENWCRYWKSLFTKRHREPLHRWQESHWDTRMRSQRQYEDKWHYVRCNPVRAGLVARAEDWPYQGTLFPFVWD